MNQLDLFPREKTMLVPDCWHIPGFLDRVDQAQCLNLARQLRDDVGMYRPWTGRVDQHGKKILMRVKVASYGWWWSLTDGYLPPVVPLPDLLFQLAAKAVKEVLPRYHPFVADTAIIQHYQPDGSLGMHSDDSEDPQLIADGSPIVSLSLGNSCSFVIEHPRTQEKFGVELRSGDAVVFGGVSRLARHSVPRLFSEQTAPPELRMNPGRINITIRRARL